MWEMDYDAAADFWNGKEKKPMEPAKLKEHIDGYISKRNTCALATSNGDLVRCTPMEYLYVDMLEHKRISVKTMKELPHPMNLIKVIPESFDLFDSSLKDKGCGSRQHYENI